MNVRLKRKIRGISLIALIITIIVTVILVSVILLSIDKNDPRKTASEDVFKSDFRTLQDELAMKKVEMKNADINADINVTISYNDQENLKEWLESIDKSILKGVVEICNGELVFVDNGLTAQEKKWAEEVGAVVGTCEEYTKKTGGYYFVGTANSTTLPSYTWTNQNVTISVDDSYAGSLKDVYTSYKYTIDSGEYKNYTSPFLVSTENNTSKVIKIKGIAINLDDEDESPIDFLEEYIARIDKVKPVAPNITRNDAGNQIQILLSGESDADSGIAKVEYSIDNAQTWNTYTSPITIENDVSVIYSRSWDVAGNVTSAADYKKLEIDTSSISKIEVTSPKTSIYKAGTEVIVEASFNSSVPAVAPSLNLTFGRGSVKTAVAKSKSNEKIIYNYIIADGDNGVMELANDTYNEEPEQRLSGNTIIADTIKPIMAYTGSSINDENRELLVTRSDDKVKIKFTASDININESELRADAIKLYINGQENNTISKDLITSSVEGQNINYELILSNFKDESGNYSIVVPSSVVNDKALNYNDEFNSSFKTTIPVEVKIDTEKPTVISVEMKSNNAYSNDEYVKNGEKVSLKVKFSENLSVAPALKIAGRNATLVSSQAGNTEYEGYIEISNNESNLTQEWLGYSISGYKDTSDIEGDLVEKQGSNAKPTNIKDTVLYDRTLPEVTPKVVYKDKSGNVLDGVVCYLANVNAPTVTENGSGLKKVEYKVNDGQWQEQRPQLEEVTKENTLKVRATDKAGNVSNEATVSIKVDRTPPKIDATILRSSDSAKLMEKTLDSGESVIVSVKGENNNAWVNKDDGGLKNLFSVSDDMAGFDKAECGQNVSGNFSSSVSTDLVATITKNQSEFSMDVTADGRRYYMVKAYDKVGNTSTMKIYADIDKTPPTYTYLASLYKADNKSFSGYKDSNGNVWCHHANVSVTTADTGSGVNVRKYRWNVTDAEWEDYTENTKTFTTPEKTNENRRLYIYVKDKAGNVAKSDSEIPSSYYSIATDVKQPDLTVKVQKSSDSTDLLEKTNVSVVSADQIKTDDNGWINKADGGVKNIVTGSDSNSGFDGTVYAFNASGNYNSVNKTDLTVKPIANETTIERTLTADGKRYYTFTAYDKVGNSRKVEVYANIDRTPPTYTYNSITLYKKDGTKINSGWCHHADISVTTTDAGSGVSARKYKWNVSDGEWEDYSSKTKTFTTPNKTNENRKLYIYVKDKAGNVSKSDSNDSSTYVTVSVDVTAPSGTVSYSRSVSNKKGTFTTSGTDSHSGFNSKSYKYYLASDVKTKNSDGLSVVAPATSDYTTKTSTSNTATYSMTAGKLYAFKVEVFDNVGNSKVLSPVYKYGPCNHYVGSTSGVKPSKALGNYSIENYYFDNEYWDCYGCMVYQNNAYGYAPNAHKAEYGKKAVLMACQYCHVPTVYLTMIGGEPRTGELEFRLWCEGNLDRTDL